MYEESCFHPRWDCVVRAYLLHIIGRTIFANNSVTFNVLYNFCWSIDCLRAVLDCVLYSTYYFHVLICWFFVACWYLWVNQFIGFVFQLTISRPNWFVFWFQLIASVSELVEFLLFIFQLIVFDLQLSDFFTVFQTHTFGSFN